MEPYDTVVVGAGAAGVAAASALAGAARRVLLLEAQGRVGGRVRSERVPGGVVELGAEWIHGQVSSTVYDLAVQNKVPLLVQDLTFEVYRSDGRRMDDELMAELINYCLVVMEEGSDVQESLGDVIERKFKQYMAERYPELLKDSDFVRNFLELMNLLVNNHEAANDWRDVSALSQYAPLAGEQHVSWHRLGYSTLFDILLNTYNNGSGLPTLDIKLNKEVINIKWPADSTGNVVVTCGDGDQYSANSVIVTVSLGVLKERHKSLFSPGLPPGKVEAIETISIGVMDKVIMTFEEEWWTKKASFFGFLWRDEDIRKLGADELWVTRVFGASTPMGARNTLTLWTSGEVAKAVETLPEEAVGRQLRALLQRFVGGARAVPRPTAVLRSTWHSNPWTRGSYSHDNSRTPQPQHAAARRTLGEPLRDAAGRARVLFAGEATDPTHFSTVHGAADSGRREARRLLPPPRPPHPPASRL